MPELSEQLLQKRENLLEILAGYGRIAVAFSGGVDSAVVAKAAREACGDRAVAVTALSPSLASGELEESKRLAEQIGIQHRIIKTAEFNNPDYLKNPSNRCYFCKTELYTQLQNLLPELEVDVILNGANCDDLGDYRPGLQAASEHQVKSPLIEAGLTKQDVRDLAHAWDLPVWDKPATPCLSSRIAYGLEVTEERIRRVDQAEAFLRETLGLRELRVRHEANELARIEIPQADLGKMLDPEIRAEISKHMNTLGFQYVTLDLDGFRSGSMNAVIPLENLKMIE